MRTLTDALARADNLRDFRKSHPATFDWSDDLQDIVLLADEVKQLNVVLDAAKGIIFPNARPTSLIFARNQREEDHDESW